MARALAVLLASLSWFGCQSQRPPFDPFLGEQRIPPPGTGTAMPPQSATPYYQGNPPPGSPPAGFNPSVPPAGSYQSPVSPTVPNATWQAPGQSALPAAAGDTVQVPVDDRPIRDDLQVQPLEGDLSQSESPVTVRPQAEVAQLQPIPASPPTYVAPYGAANIAAPGAQHAPVYGSPAVFLNGVSCCPTPQYVDPCCPNLVSAVPCDCAPSVAVHEIHHLPICNESVVYHSGTAPALLR